MLRPGEYVLGDKGYQGTDTVVVYTQILAPKRNNTNRVKAFSAKAPFLGILTTFGGTFLFLFLLGMPGS